MGENPGMRQWFTACMVVCLVSAALPSVAHAEPAQQGEGGGMQELPAAPGFMPMPSLNIPVLKNNRVTGNLMVDMVLDVASTETMQAVADNHIRLSAGYADALGKWAAAFQDAHAPANVIAIKNQLQNVTNEVIGRTDSTVLLQSVMLRR